MGRRVVGDGKMGLGRGRKEPTTSHTSLLLSFTTAAAAAAISKIRGKIVVGFLHYYY
jgi:hypothetical protein